MDQGNAALSQSTIELGLAAVLPQYRRALARAAIREDLAVALGHDFLKRGHRLRSDARIRNGQVMKRNAMILTFACDLGRRWLAKVLAVGAIADNGDEARLPKNLDVAWLNLSSDGAGFCQFVDRHRGC